MNMPIGTYIYDLAPQLDALEGYDDHDVWSVDPTLSARFRKAHTMAQPGGGYWIANDMDEVVEDHGEGEGDYDADLADFMEDWADETSWVHLGSGVNEARKITWSFWGCPQFEAYGLVLLESENGDRLESWPTV